MLVETRPAPPESRHLGQYEVVLAVSPETEAALATPERRADPDAKLSAGMAQMQRKLEGIAWPCAVGLDARRRWRLAESWRACSPT